MEKTTQQEKTGYKYPHLASFNEESALIFYALKPEQMSKKEWLFAPENPYRLPKEAEEAINVIDEIVHKSGKYTYFRYSWLARRVGKRSKTTIYYWMRQFKLLGITEKVQTPGRRKTVGFRITEEFSKYKCEADRVLRPCLEKDHSNCVRPKVDYTCTSCNRHRGGMSVEQKYEREIEMIRNDYEEQIARLEKENEKLKGAKEAKREKRAKKRASKAEARREFLGKLQPEQRVVIETYEKMTGKEFDLEQDYKGWVKLNRQLPIVAIIGIVQTAINLMTLELGMLEKAGVTEKNGVEVGKVMEKATKVYSLNYFVPQAQKIEKEIRQVYKVGYEEKIKAEKGVMGYLASNIAILEKEKAIEVVGVLKNMPLKALGGKEGIEQFIGILASKMVKKEIKAGQIDQAEGNQAMEEYIWSLKQDFKLKEEVGKKQEFLDMPRKE